MKLLSDWIILNLGATLAFSALWVAVVVVVAAFMGVRAGFVRVVGWVSGLFARKRDQAPQGGLGVSQWISGRVMKAKSPRSISTGGRSAPQPQWIADVLAERDAVRRFNERAQIGRYLADPERCMPSEAARLTDRINAGAGKPIVVGSAEWLASCPVRDWRGTGGAREDRETIIEATWQGRGKGFSDPGHVARLDAAFSRGVIHTGSRDTVAS